MPLLFLCYDEGGVMDMSVQRQLLSGEHVVWEGRPATGLILRPIEAFLSNGVQKGPPIGVEEGPPFRII